MKESISVLVLGSVFYVLGSFIYSNFNCSVWDMEFKVICSVVFLVASVGVICGLQDLKKTADE